MKMRQSGSMGITIGIGLVLVAILGMAWMEFHSLQKKNTELSQSLTKAEQARDTAINAAEVAERKLKTEKELSKAQTEQIAKHLEEKTGLQKRLRTLEAAWPKPTPKGEETPQTAQQQESSLKRIQLIWEHYCLDSQLNDCKGRKP